MRSLPVFALTACLALTGLARADQPGPDWMPAEQVRAKLEAAGYSAITKLEADDGHWDGEGTKDGQAMTFELDPKTGAILGEMPR